MDNLLLNMGLQRNSNEEDIPERGNDDLAVVDDPDTALPGDNVVSDL